MPTRALLKCVLLSFLASSGCAANSSVTDSANSKPTATSSIQDQAYLIDTQASGTILKLLPDSVIQHENLTFRLLSVEDSRCAIGVTCIWAGQLVVKLEVMNNQNDTKAITLVRKREAESAFAFGYDFRLLNVEPHPKKGKTISFNEQVVQIEIVKIE